MRFIEETAHCEQIETWRRQERAFGLCERFTANERQCVGSSNQRRFPRGRNRFGYVKARMKFGRGKIRVLDQNRNIVETITNEDLKPVV